MRSAGLPPTTGSGRAEAPVRAAARAFAILEELAASDGPVGLRELAHRCGLPVATIFRVAATLDQLGYVHRDEKRAYALGPRLAYLGQRATEQLASWAMPYLTTVTDKTGESASLATVENDRVVYVAQSPSRHSMRFTTEVGRRSYMHCTAVGKVLLAKLDDEAVTELVDRVGLPRQTSKTITDRARFLEEIRTVREQGFGVDDGEEELGVNCVAVAVDGPIAAAMSVTAPEGRLSEADWKAVVRVLQDQAELLRAELRNGSPDGSAPVS